MVSPIACLQRIALSTSRCASSLYVTYSLRRRRGKGSWSLQPGPYGSGSYREEVWLERSTRKAGGAATGEAEGDWTRKDRSTLGSTWCARTSRQGLCGRQTSKAGCKRC